MINKSNPSDEQARCRGCECEGARRDFMLKAGIGIMGVGAIAAGLPILGFVIGPAASAEGLVWIDLGPTDQFPQGQTRFGEFVDPHAAPTDGLTTRTGCWIRCIALGSFQVFSVNCAHLGCPVRWFEQSKLFLCPCHGGAYYEDGSRASGPPPRGLFEFPWRVDNGRLHIQVGILPGLEDVKP
ncbi:MAG: Rieske 2Fe-2S domain-containing protein [Planctomycetota bacterium]|nr:Rieske 2Fe-2S domain-containing protein [Planctomycetota bacterium]